MTELPSTMDNPTPNNPASGELNQTAARSSSGESNGQAAANLRSTSSASTPLPAPGLGPILQSPVLRVAAEIVDDMEHVRKANDNRFRQLTRVGPDKDGRHRGFGLTEDHPGVQRLAALIDAQKEAEKLAIGNLEKELKAHPLWPWVSATSGVGAKQFARLLGAIGDPYWNSLENRPRRGPAELWAYTGLHVVDGVVPRRKKGVQTSWNETARMRVRLIAESCLKAKTSPYNVVYYDTRAKYEDAKHDYPCIMCGTGKKPTEGIKVGKPAEPGTALRDGHKHGRALHKVGQVFLKDLFLESKRIHQLAEEG